MIEISYGIIPLKRRFKRWFVLLVRHGKGHWAFPKGHAERGESPQETASRELKEETHLDIDSFLEFPELKEHYFFTLGGKRISKTVVYFAAKVKGRVKVQESEISEALWIPLEEAEEKITFPEGKKLCRQIHSILWEKDDVVSD